MNLENKNKTNSYQEVNFNEHKIMDESFSGFQPGQGLHGVGRRFVERLSQHPQS